MEHEELERRIAQAAGHAVPDILDKILSAYDEQQKGEIIVMERPKRKKIWIAPLAAMAAVLALCVGLLGYNGQGRSVVMLDVNPSVALTVNSRERVTEARGLNQEGIAVLEGMDLKGTELGVAVNAVIGSMLQKGYVSELQNAVLVSVTDKDAGKAAQLQTQVSEAISGLFAGARLEGAVLSQSVADTEELEQLARSLNVSLGKAALISDMVGQDISLEPEALAPLSIHEIALISQSRHLAGSVTQNGTASDRAYIGQERAKEIALAHAGVAAGDVMSWEIDLDSDHGVMVYEVEFSTGIAEYEYDINARTGEIVEYKVDRHPNAPGTTPVTPPAAGYIGEDAAKAAALAAAGVRESETDFCNVHMDYDDGRPEKYEVEFTAKGVRYKYDIDLTTGAVLSQKAETTGGGTVPPTAPPVTAPVDPPASGLIGEDAAKAAALKDAGVQESDVRWCTVQLDYDDGRPEKYEVDFEAGGMEYEYKIAPTTGAVLSKEMEQSDVPTGNYITADAAKEIALAHAGLTASQIREYEVNLDTDDGIVKYVIEFESGIYDYEYEIDAVTGAILEYEIDD